MEDRFLVSRVLKDDEQAFTELIRRNKRLVEHVVAQIVKNGVEAEEVCMDVFLKVHKKLNTFKFESKLSTWIGKIAYRLALNHIRKKFPNDVSLETEESNYLADNSINPESAFTQGEREEVIQNLVHSLPHNYSVVIALYHLEERNYNEIGEITGLPEGTVKNYLFRGRKLLKEKLEKLNILDNI